MTLMLICFGVSCLFRHILLNRIAALPDCPVVCDNYCHQDIGALFDYPNLGFSVLFPQLQGKCQGITRKDGARPSPIFFLFNCYVCSALCILCSVCV
jgi:hypothetical protein